ncbi:MAG: type IV toxin-antitoxin system AbiEi family antitoxin domain-containing protein [Patescibacteria group bacterium]
MSTDKLNVKLNRFAQIAQLGEIIFHAKDLANLWQIKSQNTLHTALSRYVKKGLLFRIYRGFYAIKPIENIDSYLLGIRSLHAYAYISTETILAKAGIISQVIDKITFISSKSTKFKIGNNWYISRKLADKFLFNPAGINEKNGIMFACYERAVADMLYFNPKFLAERRGC